jgi:hypothetical protein
MDIELGRIHRRKPCGTDHTRIRKVSRIDILVRIPEVS